VLFIKTTITIVVSPGGPHYQPLATKDEGYTRKGGEEMCPSMRYARFNCPVWDPEEPDGGSGVDARVRWVQAHQNPRDCGSANYLIRGLVPIIGFGANIKLTVESTMYIALYTNRIFLLDTDLPFRYANCSSRDWSCYFEPLSKCTTADADAVVKSEGYHYGQFLMEKDHRVIRTYRVSVRQPPPDALSP
jgi:hypothetical protein